MPLVMEIVLQLATIEDLSLGAGSVIERTNIVLEAGGSIVFNASAGTAISYLGYRRSSINNIRIKWQDKQPKSLGGIKSIQRGVETSAFSMTNSETKI